MGGRGEGAEGPGEALAKGGGDLACGEAFVVVGGFEDAAVPGGVEDGGEVAYEGIRMGLGVGRDDSVPDSREGSTFHRSEACSVRWYPSTCGDR